MSGLVSGRVLAFLALVALVAAGFFVGVFVGTLLTGDEGDATSSYVPVCYSDDPPPSDDVCGEVMGG